MEVVTHRQDVWGREVILGVSWDLLWVVAAAAFTLIALHALISALRRRRPLPAGGGERLRRHAVADRIFHWVMAASVLVLLVTGVLPIVGIEFAWLTVHWIAGLVLTAAVLFHIVRALFWQDPGAMAIRPRDLREPFDAAARPAKYTLAQKFMHAAVTLAVLLVIASGLVLFALIDTPWWDRSNALEESTLGWMFLFHGLATLGLVALIALHVYFGLRPEKLFYTRSMIKGWITSGELEANHDPKRWTPEKSL